MKEPIIFDGIEKCKVESFCRKLWQPSDDEIKSIIESRWKELEEKNRKADGTLSNNKKVRVNMMYVLDKVLYLQLQLTDYKTHVATRDDPSISENQRGLALYVIASIISRDNYLVYGKTLSSEEQYKGMINVIAGAVEPEQVRIGEGLEETLFTEIREETGQMSDTIEHYQPFFVIREQIAAHPSVVHIVKSYLKREDMEKIFQEHMINLNRKRERPEIEELLFLPYNKRSMDILNRYRTHERTKITLNFMLDHIDIFN